MGAFRQVDLHPRALRFGNLAHLHHHRQELPDFGARDPAVIQVHCGGLPEVSAGRNASADSQGKDDTKTCRNGQLPQPGPSTLPTSTV